MNHPIVVAVLLGIAVAFALICSVGVMVMRDAYQRLHFASVVVAFSSLLIAIAVWMDEKDPQARNKVILTGALLFIMNAVLSVATAKAVRVRQVGHWEPHPEEMIPVVGQNKVAGADGFVEEHES